MATKMHADEPDTDVSLVGRLIAAQFPQWADSCVSPVASAGTDNALYRLGNDMVVRMPRIHWALDDVEKEQRWLPRFAPHLPLAVPVPLARGQAGEGYPWSWSVYRWLDGESARPDRLGDMRAAAEGLAAFVLALQGIDASDGPRPEPSNRGVPLTQRDVATRSAIANLEGLLDARRVTAVWDAALKAPVWDAEPVWVHGDLTPGNLLVNKGRLTAVIDFGSLNCGDPAVDLLVAWNLFSTEARDVYRSALGADDAMWARGRGWAVSVALLALSYYLHTNPSLVANSWHVIEQVLADS